MTYNPAGDLIKLGGGIYSDIRADKRAEQNNALQREFAQNGISWKVADAKRAGVHPLYALGANTVSFSPQSIGSSGLGDSLGSMGENINRSIAASATSEGRAAQLATQLAETQIEGAKLDNDIKRTRLASAARTSGTSNAQVGPPLPSIVGGVPGADKYEDAPAMIAGGGRWRHNPGWVNAEDVEKRYGDLIQEVYGMGVAVADTHENLKHWTRPYRPSTRPRNWPQWKPQTYRARGY